MLLTVDLALSGLVSKTRGLRPESKVIHHWLHSRVRAEAVSFALTEAFLVDSIRLLG